MQGRAEEKDKATQQASCRPKQHPQLGRIFLLIEPSSSKQTINETINRMT